MRRWITSEVMSLLRDDDWKVAVTPPGGDVDTECVEVRPVNCQDASTIFVTGFNVNGEIGSWSDVDIEMVEVRDGHDSRGALASSDRAICLAYGEIVWRLRNAGFVVVPSMGEYF